MSVRTSGLHDQFSSASDAPIDTFDLIVQQGRRRPDAVALTDAAGDVTYAELLADAAALSAELRRAGVRGGELVGLCLRRGRAAVVAMLGILQTGAGYVPLDPDYPPTRIAQLLADARPRCVVTDRDERAVLPGETPVLQVAPSGRPCEPAEAGTDVDVVPSGWAAEDPAYVIFTSGSSGRPKGVVVPRRALTHYCRAAGERFGLTPDDRVLQFSALGFDASVNEIFPPLAAGSRVVLRDEDMISRPDLFLDRCTTLGITLLTISTAYWNELGLALARGEARLPSSIRLVISYGEAMHAGALRRWQDHIGPGVQLLNVYGPTETTVSIIAADVTTWQGEDPVPIGHPFGRATCRVLAPDGAPVPLGEPGELHLGGAAVATGYLRRPELTAERFVRGPDGRLEYRTGDRVRQRPDGCLEFLGRLDQQLKIRGFRIEPGEIESALRALPEVADAVVLAQARGGQPRLVAHLLATRGNAGTDGGAPPVDVTPVDVTPVDVASVDVAGIDVAAVRQRLAAELPAHMIPAAFVVHDVFPLTVQKKVDRSALASMPWQVTGATGTDVDAGSGDEARLRTLWRDALGAGDIGRDDDFFELGGDSLDAVRVLGRLRREYGVELTLRGFYAAPTFADMLAALAAAPGGDSPVAGGGSEPQPETALNAMQLDFWVAEQMIPDRPVHTLGVRYRLPAGVRPELMAACLDELVRRHPALRSRVRQAGGTPRLVVEPAATLPLSCLDLRSFAPQEREHRAEQARRDAVEEPLDLAAGPLARAVLLQAAEGPDELLLVVHHLVFDGWSMSVFGDELAQLHHDLTEGREPARPAPRPLPDLATEQAARSADEVLTGYWQERLAGADLDLELPADRPHPPIRPFASARVTRRVEQALVERLRDCGRANRASLFMVVLAGVQAVLTRYTGRTDVTVLVPVAGRTRPELESVVGPLLNILPIRGDVGGEPSFTELLARVRDAVVSDLEHQELALADIIAATGRPAAANRNPLSGVVVAVQNTPAPRDGVAYAGDMAPAATPVELTITLDFPVDGPVLNLDYASEMFDAQRIDALVDHLLTLLTAATADPATPITRLPLLTAGERDRQVHRWNDAGLELPDARSVHELFERRVAAAPDSPALTFRSETVSYRHLNSAANRLAHLLRERGVTPGARVAICLDRGIELFVAMWAVLKAGGAYVPLDPAYPADRLRYMIDDSGALAMVTRTDLAAAPPVPDGVALVALDRDADLLAAHDDGNPVPAATPTDPAYVIYTSGSSGRPKGVVVEHRHLVHAAAMWQHAYQLDAGWTYQQAASFSFDMFVGETLRAHCSGGRLVVVPREVLLDPAELFALMRAEQVRCTELVPAVLRALLGHVEAARADLGFVRLLIGGGEKWTVQEYRRARRLVGPGGRVVNAYGVTEATVDNVYFDGDVDDLPADAPLPIGRPFPNNRVYVLDAHREPVPAGVVGELYLGGLGVARGYHERPELTAERFVPDPFVEHGARMYRTGDAARWSRDGEVDFLGRLDDQVKVNGYRIELGEVEAALGVVPGVQACAAAVHSTRDGVAQLVGYVVAGPASGTGAEVTEVLIRDALAVTVPTHLVPNRIVVLPALPLTPNGKLDRRALPAPPDAGGTAGVVAPRTPTERRIAAAWAAELGIEGVGIDDNFFALGGDSFSALRVVRRIEPMPALVELYRRPTVRALAALLDGRSDATEGPRRRLHRLTPGDADPALDGVTVVAVPYSGGSAIAYQPLADALPAGWALHAVELPGHDRSRADEPLLPADAVAAQVVEEIRALSGPVLLYGHCLGVAVTVEIARRLESPGGDPADQGTGDAAGPELIGVGLGAGFPTARLPGRLFDRIHRFAPTDRFVSDRQYLSYLRGRGGFTDLGSPEDEAFVLRNVRHDARDAEEYFTARYRQPVEAKLRAPVLSVVGARDRVTELYEERHREWEHVAGEVDLAVLPKAGHFFVKTHAEPLAAALVEHARRASRLGGAEAQPPDAAPDAAPDPRSPAPSLSRFAVVAAGQLVSMIGSGICALVLSIWVYRQTGSITEFAVISAVGLLPGILVGPLAGVVADRWDRRRILIASNAGAALAMAALAVLILSGGMHLWQVYLAASVTSVAGAFQRPAYLAAVAQLVPKRYLGHSNGISQLGVGMGAVFAPLVGVGLLGVIGVHGVILLDVASFLVGVTTLLLVRFPDRLFRRREEGFRAEIVNGWRYIARRPSLLIALRFFIVDNAFYLLGFAVIMPLLLIEQSPLALGAVLAAGGIGGLAGAVVMGLWGGLARRADGMLIFMGVCSIGVALVGAGPAPILAVTGMFLLAFGESMATAHWMALLQTKVGFELQGRVLAFFLTVMMLTLPVSYLVVGPLAEAYVQPLLEPGGPLVGVLGPLLGTGPSRGLALLVLISGLLQLAWAIRGWFHRPLRLIEDVLPDAIPPAEIGDRDSLQELADAQLAARR